MTIQQNISLLPYNTFRMDVRTRLFAQYESIDELRQLLNLYRDEKMLHIGAGSNLLFTTDFDGIVLHSAMTSYKIIDEDGHAVLIEAEGGLVLDQLIEQTVEQGLTGLENLSLIPGEVGASAVQNVGAYGVEAKDVIEQVKAIRIADGEQVVFSNQDCRYDYRDSIFKQELRGQFIITNVVYRLQKNGTLHLDYNGLREQLQTLSTPLTASDVRRAIIEIRNRKLPRVDEIGSAGSFFKNPIISEQAFMQLQEHYPAAPFYKMTDGVKIPAAWLIDQCGLRGTKNGGAQVYERQPLVIINTGDATPQDIITLAQRIQHTVKERFDINITPEVNYI